MPGMIKINNTPPSGPGSAPEGLMPRREALWAGGFERVWFKASSFLTGFTSSEKS